MSASLFGTGNAVSVNVDGTLVPQVFTPTNGQTIFNITNFVYVVNTNSLLVWINGQKQILGKDFTETSSSSFTLLEGVIAGDVVEIIGFPEIALTAVTVGSVSFGGGYSLNQYFLDTPLNVKSYPYLAQGTGIVDDRTSIAAADGVAAGGNLYFPPGTYLINSNITIASAIQMASGAILKPASGVTITLSLPITALHKQIFDLSLGGLIALGQGQTQVWAEWWGAKGDGTKLNNEVPFNQAINALKTTVAGVYGGDVYFERGNFYIGATIIGTDNVWLNGAGYFYSSIRAAPTAFAAASDMLYFGNGTSSMFNCGIRRCRINAGNDGNIVNVVHAQAWQQKSGFENVYIENFKTNGVALDINYGGSAQLTFRQLEVFPSADCISGANAIIIDATGFSVGWLTVNFEEVQVGCSLASVVFTVALLAAATSGTLATSWAKQTGAWWVTFSNGESRAVTLTSGLTTATWSGGLASGATANASAVPPSVAGINLNGRIVGNIQDVHLEQLTRGVSLNGAAKLVGNSLKSDGSGTVQTIIQCAGGWNPSGLPGQIDVAGVEKAGSPNYIVDNSRGPYPLANVEPGDSHAYWPPSPLKAFAGGQINGGGGAPTLSFGIGLSPLSRIGVGQYRINLITAASSISTFFVQGASSDAAAPQVSFVKNSASQFDVFTKTAAGVAADCGVFNVEVFHIT